MAPQTYEPTFVLLKRRLPASESTNLLGRVIRRYQDPTLDYTPEAPAESLTPSRFNRFLLDAQYDNEARFTAQAMQNDSRWFEFISLFSSSKTSGGTTTVTSPRIITRRLKLENDYLHALKSIPEVRRKMLEMCPLRDKVYLVVGTMSIQTGTFDRATFKNHDSSMGASLPLAIASSAAALSFGALLPCAKMIPDAEAGVKHGNSSASTATFSTAAVSDDGSLLENGEEVFAVACKVITRNWEGLGKNVKVKTRQPEYRGGQHFGEKSESDASNSESDMDEEFEAILAQGLTLVGGGLGGFRAEVPSIFNPYEPRDE